MSPDNLPILEALPEDIRNVVWHILLGLVIFLIIVLVRRIVLRIFMLPLRAFTRRTRIRYDDQLLDFLETPINLGIIALGLMIGVSVAELSAGLVNFFGHLARSLIIVGFTLSLVRLASQISFGKGQLGDLIGIKIDDKLLPFLRTGLRIVILAISAIILLQEWGYDASGVIAGLGIGGLALSLAAKDTVENLFGFSSIITDKPFSVGEFIVTPAATGIVEHVGIRSTRIRQLDQALVIVPNSKLAASQILNWSHAQKRRLDITLGISYEARSTDLRQLMARLRQSLEETEDVDTGSIIVHFVNFGASTLDVRIICMILHAGWGDFTRVAEGIRLAMMDVIEELGLEIALPSRTVYLTGDNFVIDEPAMEEGASEES